MLDSIGDHATVVVVCAGSGCCVQVALATCTPTCGHAGEPLNEGPYFDSLSLPYFDDEKFQRCLDEMHLFEAGRLFRLLGPGDPAPVEVYYSTIARHYGYDGMYMPPFAPQGTVVWVCADCLRAMTEAQHPWAEVLKAYEDRFRSAAPCLTDYHIRWMHPREVAYLVENRFPR